jgi:dolichol-phosphate mannosyltransferase
MNLSIVIPCYNEAQNVPFIAEQLFPMVEQWSQNGAVQVVLVDDGSTDDTLARLHELVGDRPWVQVVSHGQNRGLGAAVRTGFAHAQGDVIVTTDSDGTYPFAEIPRLLERLTPDVDIVVASPYHPQGRVEGVVAYRLVLSQGASLLYRLLLDWRLHTYTSLFRAYRRQVVERVPSDANGFLMPAEFLAHAILLGCRVVEYPTVLHVRRHGQSKARVARIVLAHLRFQARLLRRRLTHQRLTP